MKEKDEHKLFSSRISVKGRGRWGEGEGEDEVFPRQFVGPKDTDSFLLNSATRLSIPALVSVALMLNNVFWIRLKNMEVKRELRMTRLIQVGSVFTIEY